MIILDKTTVALRSHQCVQRIHNIIERNPLCVCMWEALESINEEDEKIKN